MTISTNTARASATPSAYHGRVRRDVFPILPGNLGRVLDFGGGTGATACWLRDAGRARSADVMDAVDAPSADRSWMIDLEDHAALTDAMHEGPWDTILALDVLEHLRDPWSTLRILRRGMAEGGCIVVSLPNARNPRVWWPLLAHGRWDYRPEGIMDRTHLRWFTRATAAEMIEAAGLLIDRHLYTLHGGRAAPLIDAATLGLTRDVCARQNVFRATADAPSMPR